MIVIDGGVGASSLGSGAIDDVAWDDRERAARTIGASLIARPDPVTGGIATDLAWIADVLGSSCYVVADVGAPLPLVATTAGRLRTASARDAALLDLYDPHTAAPAALDWLLDEGFENGTAREAAATR